MKGASLGWALALPANIRLGWKGLPEKNTSLLQKSINYGCKTFYSIGPLYDLTTDWVHPICYCTDQGAKESYSSWNLSRQ
jgi:hypothetical protein